MEPMAGWFEWVVGAASVLAEEYFPEILAVIVIVGLLWAIRRTLSRDSRTSR